MSYRTFFQQFILSMVVIGFVPMVSSLAAEPAMVAVSRPVERMVTDSEDFSAHLEAAATVELRARVTGYLEKVHFKAGSDVKKGDLLFEIDSRTYQASLNEAKAGLSVAEAVLVRRDAELRRGRDLLAKKAISKEDFDKVAADRAEAEAAAKLAQTKVASARLQLDFTKVTAPMDGRIGLARLTPGNLVVGDTTRLATIVGGDPIYVYFDMDERTLLQYQRMVRKQQIKGVRSPLSMGLVDEKGFPHKGVLDSFDVRVKPAIGTIRGRGIFANPDRILFPGMSARVRLLLGKPHKALLVAYQKAVFVEGHGYYVLVVNTKNVVERRNVTLGEWYDGLRAITSGIKPDEWVVVSSGRRQPQLGDKVKPRPIAMPGSLRSNEK